MKTKYDTSKFIKVKKTNLGDLQHKLKLAKAMIARLKKKNAAMKVEIEQLEYKINYLKNGER